MQRIAASPDAYRDVPVDLIRRSPYQPRRDFGEAELATLAASIERIGRLVHPIALRRLAEKTAAGEPVYELIAGERRWRAAQRLGWRTIPAVVSDSDDLTAAVSAFAENMDREPLTLLEKARAAQLIHEEFPGMPDSEIAAIARTNRNTIAYYRLILRLPAPVLHLAEQERLTFGHLKALCSRQLAGKTARLNELAARAARHRWTVRTLEAAISPQEEAAKPVQKPRRRDPNVVETERRISEHFAQPVDLDHQPTGKGTVTISYNDLDELEGIMRRAGMD